MASEQRVREDAEQAYREFVRENRYVSDDPKRAFVAGYLEGRKDG